MSGSLQDFATRYTAAWCSQDPARVASFFGEDGSLTINGGTPCAGRAAITEAARGFMTGFPDMVVTMDSVTGDGDNAVYHWTLTGTNTGPGGTGKPIRLISARLAPLPPKRARMSAFPSALPSPKP